MPFVFVSQNNLCCSVVNQLLPQRDDSSKINFMVSTRERMKRFWLKMLILRSGQYDGPLLFCVARVKKGGGAWGGGESLS